MASFATSAASTRTASSSSSRLATLRPRSTTLFAAAPAPAARRARAAARAAAVDGAPAAVEQQPITLTPAALAQLERLRREEGRPSVLLRMGVRAGGCSGMSYDMKFEEEKNIDPEDDTVLEFPAAEGAAAPAAPMRVAVDGKSLLFLFGMQVDYSDALVGGGFKFINPSATETCGCGKSFSA